VYTDLTERYDPNYAVRKKAPCFTVKHGAVELRLRTDVSRQSASAVRSHTVALVAAD